MCILIRCDHCLSKSKLTKSSVTRCTNVEIDCCKWEDFSKTSAIFLYSLISNNSSSWCRRFFDNNNLIEGWLWNRIVADSFTQILFITIRNSLISTSDACKVGFIVSCPFFEVWKIHLKCSSNCNQSTSKG